MLNKQKSIKDVKSTKNANSYGRDINTLFLSFFLIKNLKLKKLKKQTILQR